MSFQHRALLVLVARGQDRLTKITVQAVQVAVGQPVGVRGEGARYRSYGLSAHQVLALALVRLLWLPGWSSQYCFSEDADQMGFLCRILHPICKLYMACYGCHKMDFLASI